MQKAHPSLRVEEVGDASAEKALDKTLGKDFKRAEMLSIPLTLGILLAVFGSLVAAVVPRRPRAHRVHGGRRDSLR